MEDTLEVLALPLGPVRTGGSGLTSLKLRFLS